jgi:PPOX class probable F420-dependent enzyme
VDEDEARERMAAARVARLATVAEDGGPHLVPITLAVLGSRIVTVIDHKPKITRNLSRLRNIAANPQVCVLADGYSDDWTQLWWVRADGHARVVPDVGSYELRSLMAKYPQYRDRRPEGPMIDITVTRWTAWSYT